MFFGGVLSLSALVGLPTASMAQTEEADVDVRLRIRCVLDEFAETHVAGRIASFVWTRGGVPYRIVTPPASAPAPADQVGGLRCDTFDGPFNAKGVAVKTSKRLTAPPDATGFTYRVVAAELGLEDDETAPVGRTVCEGAVNFRRNEDFLTQEDMASSEYRADCSVDGRSRVVFQLIVPKPAP